MWRAVSRAASLRARAGPAVRRLATAAGDNKSPRDSAKGSGSGSGASASGATSAAAEKMRQQMLARFGKDRQQPQPQRFQSAGVSASESLVSGMAESEPDYGVSRKGLLKNSKPFYQSNTNAMPVPVPVPMSTPPQLHRRADTLHCDVP